MKLVGKVKEAHSLKGELYVLIFAGEANWVESIEAVYLGPIESEQLKPYKISKYKHHKKGLILKLVGLEDRTQAEALEGFGLYIKESALISEPGETIYLGEILGFELFDQEGANHGPVVDLNSNGIQDLLVIRKEKNEFLIPFIAEFIVQIDYENKKIHMKLPEGLFEV